LRQIKVYLKSISGVLVVFFHRRRISCVGAVQHKYSGNFRRLAKVLQELQKCTKVAGKLDNFVIIKKDNISSFQ